VRRRLAIVALVPVALAGVAVALLTAGAGQADPAGPAPTSATTPGAVQLVSGQPLAQPPVVRAKNGVLRLRLEAAKGQARIAGRILGDFTTYNGLYPAPTLWVEPGDRIELEIVNHLEHETNVHTHGLHVDPAGIADNVLRLMQPGSTSRTVIDVPKDHEQGTYWYHPHHHGHVDDQVYGGLAGALLIGDPLRPFPALKGIRRQLMLLQGVQLSPDRARLVPEGQDVNTETLLVNGQLRPIVQMRPGEVQLWRLANISNDHFYRLRLSGHRLHVLAQDGNTLGRLSTTDTLVLAPGQRADVLVRAGIQGRFVLEQLPFDQGFAKFGRETLLTLEVSGKSVGRKRALPQNLQPLDLLEGKPDAKRTLTFTEVDGNPGFLINGEAFDHNRINELVKLGRLQEWTLVNESGEDHPFHLHTNDFLVTKVNGKPAPIRGYRDTALIPRNGGSLTIRFAATDFLGKVVYHCHILFHEDHGMMGLIEWIGPNGERSTTPCPDCPERIGAGHSGHSGPHPALSPSG
jgi:FtsP/CotA-like multicopper oxidase with cupredoxin domain